MRRLTKKGKERARQQVNEHELVDPDYSLVPLTKANHHRSKHDLPPLAHLHGRPVMTQPFNLPDRPAQSGFMLALGTSTKRRNKPQAQPSNPSTEPLDDSNSNVYTFGNIDYGTFSTPTQPARSRHRVRRESQWTTWLTKIIPSIRDSYLELLYRTKSLRNYPPEPSKHRCECNQSECRALAVTIITFTEITKLDLTICPCRPAARQLVEAGMFPCAPVHPTLAVDIRVLEFVSRLFLHLPPNNTAWCAALQSFLESQGYTLAGKDPLRRRFGNALQFYNCLKDSVVFTLDKVTTSIRNPVPPPTLVSFEEDDPETDCDEPNARDSLFTATPLAQRPTSTPRNPQKRHRDEPDTEEEDADLDGSPFPDPPARERPSEYLRARCPCCFGGEFPREGLMGPDALVSLDACFTQKRRQKDRDPHIGHPRTVFLPEQDVNATEAYVESVRSSASRSRKRRRQEDEEDKIEDGMLISNAVLAGCEKSFTAADDSRMKASTQFFGCTALMGLICRHDRVLWLVNMSSAGEKQHYVIALLETLFQHLPHTFSVGVLYDIACQLHRSCVKFGFLDRYLNRISFGISVFHAFGHQWPCQVAYHPRKVVGFGLTDGEGCERFWYSISGLVAYLRVCGYHRRLYTLNSQVAHSSHNSLLNLGHWLARKRVLCLKKRTEAMDTLADCPEDEERLRDEWASQVGHQTKPLPRQSATKGKKAVEEALRLSKALDIASKRLRRLEQTLTSSNATDYEYAEAELQLESAQAEHKKAKDKLRIKCQALGVSATTKLNTLLNNPYISARQNAIALKRRLRERLQHRKFELDPLERAHRRKALDKKAHRQTEDAVKRREPTIDKLARQFNKLCDDMESLIKAKKAPRGSRPPAKIDLQGLYSLDVDDDIWQDIGLQDDEDAAAEPPAWLSKESVRNGIKSILARDRCEEEETRLIHERCALQEWFSEEWLINEECLKQTQCDKAKHYQFLRRRNELIHLCALWQMSLDGMSVGDNDPPVWGPTNVETLAANIERYTDNVVNNSFDEDVSDNEVDEDDVDPTYFAALDAVNMADAFRADIGSEELGIMGTHIDHDDPFQ
ncbi:hypothetical protein EYR38_009924 [Pleurotus pulmonarius]|nr:hypothetical protein EYR38_009924 [Pleurotus pulmonarius]